MAVRLPPRIGYVQGERYFPPKPRIGPLGYNPRLETIQTYLPPAGQESIGASATRTFQATLGYIVTTVELDVPADMDAELTFDGATVHNVDDGAGSSGGLTFGDLAARIGRSVNRAELTVTENSGAAQDVRYVLNGFPVTD